MREDVVDIRQLLGSFTQIIRRPDFPDSDVITRFLDLDLSGSRITTTKSGNMMISRARLNGHPSVVDLICAIAPRREIWLLFQSSIPYRDIKDEVFGTHQRTKLSKYSAGFGVLFEIDGWTCGFTASSPEGDLDSLFCEEASDYRMGNAAPVQSFQSCAPIDGMSAIDLHRLLDGLTQVIRSSDFPNAETIARVLALDIAKSRILNTQLNNMFINGASLNRSGWEIDIACGIKPWREIWLTFSKPFIPFRDVKDEIFGTNQRLQPSELRASVGLLFDRDGLSFGLRAASPEGNIECLFCEGPRPTLI